MEAKTDLIFLEKKNLYAPKMFLGNEYMRKGSDMSPFPDVNLIVGQVVKEFPGFARNDKDFILYECSHNNGFASTNAQVRKTDKVNNQHYVCGGVNALFSNCNSGDKEYMPKFKGLLDKAGLVHLEIEPDDLNIGIETSDRNIILSSMKIGPDYKFALIRNQMRPDIEMFNNSALVVGPHRTFPSEEEIKFDALSVAAITQAMNETFTDDFLHCEESYDDPRNDLSDYCV